MSIQIQEVEHVAMLARLHLSHEEKERYTAQLNAILAYVDKLRELHTADVPPTTHVLSLQNVMRADEVRPSLSLEKVMANAPAEEAGQFQVPAILEGNE